MAGHLTKARSHTPTRFANGIKAITDHHPLCPVRFTIRQNGTRKIGRMMNIITNGEPRKALMDSASITEHRA
jgi:hypothetical protein